MIPLPGFLKGHNIQLSLHNHGHRPLRVCCHCRLSIFRVVCHSRKWGELQPNSSLSLRCLLLLRCRVPVCGGGRHREKDGLLDADVAIVWREREFEFEFPASCQLLTLMRLRRYCERRRSRPYRSRRKSSSSLACFRRSRCIGEGIRFGYMS